jgi:uncharacterized membrane protein required for colicin V production
MTQKQIVATLAVLGVLLAAGFVLAFSPLADNLFTEGNDTMDDLFGLVLGMLVIVAVAGGGIISVIACCNLGKRLGYDPYAGLLLLIPLVNIMVFFLWAFQQSPNEKAIVRFKRERQPETKPAATSAIDINTSES